jgi:hypothetical protein
MSGDGVSVRGAVNSVWYGPRVPDGQEHHVPDYIALLQEMCDDFDAFQQRERLTLVRRV